jgi:hypothetical protein
VKYHADLSPRVTNGTAGFPSDQLIRNIRVGLLECGWFREDAQNAVTPRDFVVMLLSPHRGNELVQYYRDPKNLLAAIPNSDRLWGLPQGPFVGELTYGDIIRVLQRQRSWFSRPERQVLDHLVEYLAFKLERSTTTHCISETHNHNPGV